MNIILLFVVILLILFYIFVIRSASRKKSIITKNKIKFIFLLYCCLLLISTAAVYALPAEDFFNPGEIENQEQFTKAGMIYDLIARGRIQDIPGVNKNISSSYDLEGNRLKLELSQKGNYVISHLDVWIERKDTNDGKIEASNYVSPFLIDNIAFTDRVIAPDISFHDNILTITPHRTLIEFFRFEADFTANQFLQEQNTPYTNKTAFGIQAVYLKIPSNVEVVADKGLNVQYVAP